MNFRCKAGDHYKEMMAALKDYNERNNVELDIMCYSKEATILNKIVFGSAKAKQRDEASEHELDLMNELQLENTMLLESNINAVERVKMLQHRAAFIMRKQLKSIKPTN
jgi:hypothetical protein